ncbi:MAG TPA: LCP family protein [Candidatus Limnocylindrales bacterium]|nr:LCP family protein [Candidatus Limnocylindrales bacterium]
MQDPDPRPPGRRSPFVAAVLSFLFPGLGQVYAGFSGRGLALAAPLILVLALVAGTLADRTTRDWLLSELASPTVLLMVLAADLLLLAYRLLAVIDAFRLTAAADAYRYAGLVPDLRAGRSRTSLAPLSVAGLVGVLLVTPILHVGVARYDLLAYDLLTSISSPIEPEGSPSASPTVSATAGGATASATESPSPSPIATAPAWTGKDRLNILLVGADQRPAERTFNTDTMIVVSVDPTTGQAAMLSLPRDMSNIPLPPSWPAARHYANGLFPGKITTLWTVAASSPGLFPFPGNTTTRGFEALKGTLGYLYGLDVQYYIEVNFDGFQQIVDTLGGVTIDVQVPVTDQHYPDPDSGPQNLYIPAGLQHLDGDRALAYARSRHASSDFDRAARQQRVILSVRQQTDPVTVLANLDSLVAAAKSAVHTDIPADLFPSLVRLAEQVDLKDLRQLVFTPPTYGTECNDPRASCYYSLYAKVPAIREAVKEMFTPHPALDKQRDRLAAEGATVSVYNGSGQNGQASTITAYLQYLGFDATVGSRNGGRADRTTYTSTVVTAYNGAETRLPDTAAVLAKTFGVTVVRAIDPTISDDFVVVTGSKTPNLSPPD